MKNRPLKAWMISTGAMIILMIGVVAQWHAYTPEIAPMVDIPGAHILSASGGTYLLEVDLSILHPHIVGEYRSSDDIWILGDIDTLDRSDPSQSGSIRINGTFFRDVERLRPGEASRLAFPLWHEGRLSGYDGKGEGYGLRYLTWSRDTGVQIDTSYPSQSGSELIITGLAPLSDKDGIGSRSVGRTYIGVLSPYKLLILVAEGLSESEAQDTLKKYGSIDEVMLDGGPSSALMYDGRIYLKNTNPIAHAIEWRAISTPKNGH